MIVKRAETFRSDPEGSTPSRQWLSRPAGSEPCTCAATPRVKRMAAGAEAAGQPRNQSMPKPSWSGTRGQHRCGC
jgi:hypothetical protein